MVILSTDAALIENLRKATPRSMPITQAPELDDIADDLPQLNPGVLLVDSTDAPDYLSLLPQLTQHFPELVIIVVGKREEGPRLMGLAASGRIFRFLLKPLSHGQTRLALAAAVTHHFELRASNERHAAPPAPIESRAKAFMASYGALAAGVAVTVGLIWFAVQLLTAERRPAPVNAMLPESGMPQRPDPLKSELALAREAFAAGRYVEPAGESALDFYRSALEIDPSSEEAKAGARGVVDRLLEMAEGALTAERIEDAVRYLEMARDVDPTHVRVAFLDTHIARERERLKLSQQKDVANRVRSLLTNAAEDVENNRLIAPSGNNAREALLEARRLDPTDPMVSAAIRDLINRLTVAAQTSLAENRPQDSRAYVAAARGLGSSAVALSTVERGLAEESRQAASIDAIIAEVRQRLDEGKLIDPTGSSARDSIAALQRTASHRPEVDQLSRELSARLVTAGREALAASNFDRTATLLGAAREVSGSNQASIAAVEKELLDARAANAVVKAATLVRTAEFLPFYPPAARSKQVEGWVDLEFTISPEGVPEEITVRDAQPARVFDRAAIESVRRWRFKPIVRNGTPVAQRAEMRMRFELK